MLRIYSDQGSLRVDLGDHMRYTYEDSYEKSNSDWSSPRSVHYLLYYHSGLITESLAMNLDLPSGYFFMFQDYV